MSLLRKIIVKITTNLAPDMYKEGRDNEREPEESDIDEMVAWCDDLDFDNYVNNWLELATAVTLPASKVFSIVTR